MSYMRHHAVLVTSWDNVAITRAHQFATDLVTHYDGLGPAIVSPLSPTTINAYRSFVVFPDGSHEGWGESDQGDDYRRALLDHFDQNERDEDGGSALDWCLVQYGDEDGDNRMLRHDAEWVDVTDRVIPGTAETKPGRPT